MVRERGRVLEKRLLQPLHHPPRRAHGTESISCRHVSVKLVSHFPPNPSSLLHFPLLHHHSQPLYQPKQAFSRTIPNKRPMRLIPHHLHNPAINLRQPPRIHSQELVLDRPNIRLAVLHRGAAPGRAAAVRAATVPRRAEEIHGAAGGTGHGEGLVRIRVFGAPEVGFWD